MERERERGGEGGEGRERERGAGSREQRGIRILGGKYRLLALPTQAHLLN